MKQAITGVLCIAGCIVVAACSKSPAATPTTTEAPSESARPVPPMPGSDRDSHGCIGSAGYRWCAKENNCVRPWELAKEKGFSVDKGAVDAYCGP